MNRTKHEHDLNREELKRLLDFLHEAPESTVEDHLPDERLRAYVREELPRSMVEQMDRHLASCEDCAERMEWLLAMTEAMAGQAQRRQPAERALVSLSKVDPCAPGWTERAIEQRDFYVLPASCAQRRLWFVDRMAPGSPLYNVPAAWRLRGPLDRAALAGA